VPIDQKYVPARQNKSRDFGRNVVRARNTSGETAFAKGGKWEPRRAVMYTMAQAMGLRPKPNPSVLLAQVTQVALGCCSDCRGCTKGLSVRRTRIFLRHPPSHARDIRGPA
jgi:hypothetical protein